jgi:hypothetical protein
MLSKSMPITFDIYPLKPDGSGMELWYLFFCYILFKKQFNIQMVKPTTNLSIFIMLLSGLSMKVARVSI